MMFNLTAMMICVGAAGTVSSRMIMSFSRDRGFGHVSRFLSPVHARLKVPVYCLVFCGGWGIVFGLLCGLRRLECLLTSRPRLVRRVQRHPCCCDPPAADQLYNTE